MRLEHIAFNVADAAGLAAWYVANFDMKIARSIAEPPFIHFLSDSAGRSLIEIYSDQRGARLDYAANHAVAFHLAFAVDDIQRERERLLAAGASPDGDVDHRDNGDKLAFLRDPWGHAIQLVERVNKMID